MARAWLILADILVTLLLLLSLILFYLYPLKQEIPIKQQKPETFTLPSLEENITLETLRLNTLELNATITLDDLMRMGQQSSAEEYFIENEFITKTLEEGLVELSAKAGDPLFIRIFKEESLLEIWIRSEEEYKHLKDYRICAYSGYLGPKIKEGDRQSPEGFYKIKKHQLNPNSKFHLSFNLGFPNKYDREHKRTGSFLMVHGNCISIGCYAMTDEKIEEIYTLVESALQKGQKYVQVHAYPFRMTEENMVLYSDNEWYDFWMNLKEGYDYFEAEHLPPLVKVENKQYSIHEGNE